MGSGAVNKSTIEAAINSAAVGGTPCSLSSPCVVRIRAGSFTVTSIRSQKDGVVIRGAGAASTKLTLIGDAGCIGTGGQVCFYRAGGGYAQSPSGTANWTAGYTQGASKITLTGVSGTPLQVGTIIGLDQFMDTTDTGGITQCEGGFCGGTGQTAGRTNRAQTELKRIVDCRNDHNTTVGLACDNLTNMTITPGLHMNNWRSSQSPGAWWWGTPALTMRMCGIEDISLVQSGVQTNIIAINDAYNCWVRGVRALFQGRNSVQLWGAARVTIRDSYFGVAQSHDTTSYGIETLSTSNILIENNIFYYMTAPILGAFMGSAITYNYAVDSFFSPGGGYAFAMLWSHTSGGGMTLVEGNQAVGAIHDDDAGNTPLYTYFRNHFRGKNEGTLGTTHQLPFIIEDFGRGLNIIANVLGLSGFSTTYEHSNRSTGPTPLGSTSDPDHSIYSLGDTPLSTLTWDPVVWQTILRWGNYDVVTGTTRFNSGEVPTTGVAFVNGNPVPSCTPTCLGQIQAIPSLIYSSRPGWFVTRWGTPAWPPIGPDVTGGNHPDPGLGGRVYSIPARLCYNNTPSDPAYPGFPGPSVKLFDAATCYAAGAGTAPPGVPTNLRILSP